jgi:Arylsulfotransferase (ASST)
MPAHLGPGWSLRKLKSSARVRLALSCVGAAAVLLCVFGAAGRSYAVPTPVYVFPIPGSHTALPASQITLRGLPVSQFGTITVTGSRSGVHAGTVEPDSDGRGGSFLAAKPFAAGETVTVHTGLNIVGGSDGSYQFVVASPAGRIPIGHRPPTPRVGGDVQRFHSEPGLVPVRVKTTTRGRTARGYIFLGPLAGPVQSGPMILDSHGRLIWFHPLRKGVEATDVRVQSYQGHAVLTWWQGNVNAAGVGQGDDVIDDTTYTQIATVHAANGLQSDLHEFQLTSQNTALVTAYTPVYWTVGNKRRIVLDSVVQEIDVPTGLVLFQWDSLDHVPLSSSYEGVPRSRYHPYDYFHVNSIQQDTDGNLIVSSRDTFAAYKINHDTGQVMWILGGKRSSFKMGHGARFAFQHDVEVHGNDNTVTAFDDGGGPPRVHRWSRGLTLALNFHRMSATLIGQDEHSPPLSSDFEGNDQVLPGGDHFVGWGQLPYFTEFNSRGRTVFDGHFVDANANYRAYKFSWTGRPQYPPSVAASERRHVTVVWASWNGATAIRRWRVFGGPSRRSMEPLRTVGIRGFETTIPIRRERYVEVQALDGKGRPLKSSAVVRAR